jgi:hypothetical protein
VIAFGTNITISLTQASARLPLFAIPLPMNVRLFNFDRAQLHSANGYNEVKTDHLVGRAFEHPETLVYDFEI